MTEATRTDWIRSQLLIALNLYHKVAFGSSTRTPGRSPGKDARGDHCAHVEALRNPGLLAGGRKPSALPMKLSNLASIDPEFRRTGRKGLKGAPRLDPGAFDRAIWAEYHARGCFNNALGSEREEFRDQARRRGRA